MCLTLRSFVSISKLKYLHSFIYNKPHFKTNSLKNREINATHQFCPRLSFFMFFVDNGFDTTA